MPWLQIGLKLAPFIIAAVRSVEKTSAKKGNDKREDALAFVDELLSSVEGTCNANISKVDEVREATKELIDAYVKLQNIIAKLKE